MTLAVLNFLALENLRDANEIFSLYVNDVQSKKGSSSKKSKAKGPESDLAKFVEYLLQTCTRDAQPLFKVMVISLCFCLDGI